MALTNGDTLAMLLLQRGSMQEKVRGVWRLRVYVGVDLITGAKRQAAVPGRSHPQFLRFPPRDRSSREPWAAVPWVMPQPGDRSPASVDLPGLHRRAGGGATVRALAAVVEAAHLRSVRPG
jgi:hypothetical protein